MEQADVSEKRQHKKRKGEVMDDIDRAQNNEQIFREVALRNAHNIDVRDYEAELCNGCDYATKSSYGKSCEAWAECLQDLARREKAIR